MANVPRAQRHPTRPRPEEVTAAVLAAYGIADEKALRSRANQEGFQTWVYLLRRGSNLPLAQVAARSKVSTSRILKIQGAFELA
jgi:hypothetical protein